MKIERWHKKDVSLAWKMWRTTYAVAQELFSSHDVDVGSKLLLRSLDITSMPERGHAIDYGCGYGVLGLAVADALPGWTVDLVDRDALAVAFAQWNADHMDRETGSARALVGLGVETAPEQGAQLILWNVPGKAGEEVLTHLTADVSDALAEDGLLALVVVNPLADVIRAALVEHPGVEIAHDTTHAEHCLIHAKRRTGKEPMNPADPFDRGVFDRPLAEFGVDDFDYDITPVVGIPEYDSYSFSTQIVFDAFRTLSGPADSVLVMRPGQGHVPLVLGNQLRPSRLTMVDRDQLALRASARALVDVGVRVSRIEIVANPDLVDVPRGDGFDLAVLMLEDQVRNDLHITRLDDLADLVVPGGLVIVGGTSSVVSRFLSFAAKSKQWKVRDRFRRNGASSARLERTR